MYKSRHYSKLIKTKSSNCTRGSSFRILAILYLQPTIYKSMHHSTHFYINLCTYLQPNNKHQHPTSK